MILHTILAALAPIVLGLLVGYGSGKTGFVKREYTQAFADFVVKIALPFALFLAAAQSSPKVLLNIDYMLALAVGLIVAYAIAFISGKWFFFKSDQGIGDVSALCLISGYGILWTAGVTRNCRFFRLNRDGDGEFDLYGDYYSTDIIDDLF